MNSFEKEFFEKLKERVGKKHFSPSCVTYYKMCGLVKTEDVVPVLDNLVSLGFLKKDTFGKRYYIVKGVREASDSSVSSFLNKIKEKVGDNLFSPSLVSYYKIGGLLHTEDVIPLLNKFEQEGKLYRIGNKYSFSKKTKEQEEEDSIYNKEYRSNLQDEIKKYKTFIVTTAVSGKKANKNFVRSLMNYAKCNKALPLVLPCEDVASRGKKAKPIDLDKELKDFRVIFKGTYLNKNLYLSAIKCSAKQINPLTGLNRVPKKINASIILASPKRHLKYMPSMSNPTALMTPGAVTVSNYDTDKILSQRCSALAELDHVYGAIIVEIENDEIFHFRGVTANERGSFTDAGVIYCPDGKVGIGMKGTVMVLGDSHTGSHDENLLVKILEVIDKLSVKTLILHDVFNAHSISHHNINKFMERAIREEEGKLSLRDELQNLTNYLKILKSHVDELVIVDSNHDRHLERYLQEQRYVEDTKNIRIASKLIEPCLDKKNVVQYAVEEIFNFKDPNIKWLKVDESYVKYGVELGIHGDLGANGGKGNIRTYRDYIGNCVVGHSHSGCILDEAYSVGTTSELRQGYNKGLSNWTRTCCLIYEDGTKQLINFIPDGKGSYSYGNI